MRSRKETETALQAMGYQGPALDLLLQAGAPARQEARMEDAARVAWEAAALPGKAPPPYPVRGEPPLSAPERKIRAEHATRAGLLVLAELAGTGGGLDAGLEWPAPERLPAFRGLGSGNRHAADGPAWEEALVAAARVLRRAAFDTPEREYQMVGAENVVRMHLGDDGAVVAMLGDCDARLVDPPGEIPAYWTIHLVAFARRGVLATAPPEAGIPPEVVDDARWVGQGWRLEGEAQAWCALLQACLAQVED